MTADQTSWNYFGDELREVILRQQQIPYEPFGVSNYSLACSTRQWVATGYAGAALQWIRLGTLASAQKMLVTSLAGLGRQYFVAPAFWRSPGVSCRDQNPRPVHLAPPLSISSAGCRSPSD